MADAPTQALGAEIKPETQKKTIKVKRPSARPPLQRTRPGDGVEATGGAPVQFITRPKQAEDTAHWTFVTVSFAAVAVAFLLIYVLAAQTFGPNISLSQLSYGAYDMELPWPGKIAK